LIVKLAGYNVLHAIGLLIFCCLLVFVRASPGNAQGSVPAVIEGNYFKRDAGDAMMDFANGLNHQLGNWIVRLENNFYNMRGQGAPNKFIFQASRATVVYLGYGAGTAFSPAAELTRCDLFGAGHLKIVGPFRLNGYMGAQANGAPDPSCH
jgi:hypothetical protein